MPSRVAAFTLLFFALHGTAFAIEDDCRDSSSEGEQCWYDVEDGPVGICVGESPNNCGPDIGSCWNGVCRIVRCDGGQPGDACSVESEYSDKLDGICAERCLRRDRVTGECTDESPRIVCQPPEYLTEPEEKDSEAGGCAVGSGPTDGALGLVCLGLFALRRRRSEHPSLRDEPAGV